MFLVKESTESYLKKISEISELCLYNMYVSTCKCMNMIQTQSFLTLTVTSDPITLHSTFSVPMTNRKYSTIASTHWPNDHIQVLLPLSLIKPYIFLLWNVKHRICKHVHILHVFKSANISDEMDNTESYTEWYIFMLCQEYIFFHVS